MKCRLVLVDSCEVVYFKMWTCKSANLCLRIIDINKPCTLVSLNGHNMMGLEVEDRKWALWSLDLGPIEAFGLVVETQLCEHSV